MVCVITNFKKLVKSVLSSDRNYYLSDTLRVMKPTGNVICKVFQDVCVSLVDDAMHHTLDFVCHISTWVFSTKTALIE